MKEIRLLYFLLFLVSGHIAVGQTVPTGREPYNQLYNNQQIDPSMRPADPDSLNNEVEVISLAPKLYMWNISEELGNIIPIPVDTAHHQFQNTNLTEGMNGHYNYLGNLGSPRLSRIFFDRKQPTQSLFLEPFSDFIEHPQYHPFTNSNIPYTNVTYYKTFDKLYGEERLKTYFSVNVNKQLAFGFNFDYLYGRGYYSNQSTSYLKAGVFGSYISDKYRAHVVYNAFNMKMAENGGITNDLYITSPDSLGEKNIKTPNIPVRMSNTWNRNKNFYVYLTHRYNLGFYRDIPDPTSPNDTIEDFVPVTSFIHTVKMERSRHNYLSKNESPADYLDAYFSPNASNDSTTYLGVKNTVGIALLEGFNKYAKAGLTAFISHKYSRYNLMSLEPTPNNYTEHDVFVGGELSKREGRVLHYNAIGEVGLAGKAIGQFSVKGDINLNFHLWKDTVNFIARGSISNTLPMFYMRHYHSNHFWWDNDNMDKEFRTRLEGELNIDRWGTNLSAGVENIKNYTYFNQVATPAQHSDNIQIVAARFKQNFRLGVFHLDNEVVWQKSSNERIIPLPDISLYANFYIAAKLAKKVLSIELGADVRYFTEYLAPAYTPAIQQFHIQSNNIDERVKIGNYPIVNVYANLHLKRTRFFVMMYHVNQGMGNNNYFLAPHYPINQSLLKFGLSWNFYD